jgi:hypothetical protein
MRFVRFVLSFAVAAAALPALAEDLTIVTSVSGAQGAATTTTQYFTDSRFRMAGADGDTIFDAQSGAIVFVDNKKKQYWESSLDEMNTAFEAMNAQMKQLEEQMKGNPMAAQMMEKMMGGAGEVSVTKGSNPRTIAGYACDHWLVTMGKAMKMEIWATSKLVPPTRFYASRKAMFAANPMLQKFARAFDEMQKIGGFTLAETTSVSMMGRSMTTSSEATEVKRGAIPASAFEVPAGYKKIDSPIKQMQKGMGK